MKILKELLETSRSNTFTVNTRIAGIPAQVKVEYIPAQRGARERGLQLEPDYPEDIEIVAVYDRKGYKAPWLEKKMTKKDEARIVKDALEQLHFTDNGYDYD